MTDSSNLHSECLWDPVWTGVWGIPPADGHSWRSGSVFATRTQLWINCCLSQSIQVTHLEKTVRWTRTPANGVWTPAKWGGAWPEGSHLLGMSPVLKSRRVGVGSELLILLWRAVELCEAVLTAPQHLLTILDSVLSSLSLSPFWACEWGPLFGARSCP